MRGDEMRPGLDVENLSFTFGLTRIVAAPMRGRGMSA